nr:MAG TPA: hypothetical protein [Caudoviricetes sp.]
MKNFLVQLWSVLKPQAGKIVSFVAGALCSAFGVALSPEVAQKLTEFVNALLSSGAI